MIKQSLIFLVIILSFTGFSKRESSNKDDEKGLTVAQYNQKTSVKDKIVLVYFNADWCVPCVKLKPIIQQIETEESGKAHVLKINVDANPEIASHFEINTLPLFFIYRNGKLVWEYTGLLSKKDITDKLDLYKY